MRCLILYNGYSDMPPYREQIERLRGEFARRGVEVDCRRNREFLFHIRDGEVSADGDWDFCVFLDKDAYTSVMVERLGIPVFNRPDAVAVCDDKMLTYLALADSGFDMPDTTPGPLFYDPSMPVDEKSVDVIEGRYGYPLVVKESYGSSGKNVHLVRNRAGLLEAMTRLRGRRYLIQEFVRSSVGEDLRVIVIGGRAIGGMVRRSDDDFRSNAALGGRTYPAEVSDASRRISERIASVLGLDYCGIDLLKDGDGDYTIVCEVNSNAFFSAFEATTGIDVAGMYADHIIGEVTGRSGPPLDHQMPGDQEEHRRPDDQYQQRRPRERVPEDRRPDARGRMGQRQESYRGLHRTAHAVQ